MNRLVCWLGLLLLPLGAFAQVFGTVDAVTGPVNVVSADGATVTPVVGQKLLVGQTVQTQAAGELHAVTEDGGLLALRPNTTFKMLRYQATQDDKSVIDMSLVRGALRSITGWIGKLNPSGYRVNTATATIGIRGTDHEVTFVEAGTGRDHAGTYDSVLEGATFVRSAQGELHLEAGQHGFAARDGQLTPRLLAERPEFLGQRVRQVIDANPDGPKAVREKLDNMTDEQREAARKKLLRRAQRRNAD